MTRTRQAAQWQGRTLRSLRGFRHTLTVDGVVARGWPDAPVVARVEEPSFGSIAVEARPTPAGTSFYVDGAWVGGAGWEEAVTERLGAAAELHRAAVASAGGDDVRDAVQRVRAAAEVQRLASRAQAAQR